MKKRVRPGLTLGIAIPIILTLVLAFCGLNGPQPEVTVTPVVRVVSVPEPAVVDFAATVVEGESNPDETVEIRVEPGEKDISDLYFVIYDREGKFVDIHKAEDEVKYDRKDIGWVLLGRVFDADGVTIITKTNLDILVGTGTNDYTAEVVFE